MSTTPGQQRTEPGTPRRPPRPPRGPLSVAVYLALLVVGLFEGLIGSFEYAQGPAPLASLGFCALIVATCLLAGWGMRSFAAAVLPAVGWIAASFVLSMPAAGGSVIITNTTAGKWYLYGGALSAAIGVGAAFVFWVRAQPPPRLRTPEMPEIILKPEPRLESNAKLWNFREGLVIRTDN